MLDNIAHDFDEGFERFPLPCRWRPRLETYFCDDEWLGEDCGDGFGKGAEDWLMSANKYKLESEKGNMEHTEGF